MSALVRTLLAKDPDDRPPEMDLVAAELRALRDKPFPAARTPAVRAPDPPRALRR